MKKILNNCTIGIGIALVILGIIGICFDFVYNGDFHFENYSFTKFVVGTLLVGIGFSAPAIVYENENIALGIQTLIHMGIGCIVYTVVAFLVGWIPIQLGLLKCLFVLLSEIAFAFVIWFCFLIYYRKLGRRINQRIKEMKADN